MATQTQTQEQCTKCHKTVTLGVNAITTRHGTRCDNCANVVRDIAGMAWSTEPNLCTCCEYAGEDPECPVHSEDQ